jgi:hypothetical protein
MGKKMKTVPRPTPDIGAALAGMGTAFMPDMGQATTVPPKIPPPILPPGQGPMRRPSSKPSKRFIKKMSKPLPGQASRASVASNGMRKKASDAIVNSRPKMRGKPDKMSETVDKEQRKQINDILPKEEKKQRA